MLPFRADILYARQWEFHWYLDILRRVEKEKREAGNEPRTSEAQTAQVQEFIKAFTPECERVQMKRAIERLERLRRILPILSLSNLIWELEELDRAIRDDLHDKKFVYIPEDDVAFYEQEKLFGQKVCRNFKSTRNDVMEAGSCFATGRYTACVFHCMRVVEKGLHALAHHLNNTFGTNINFHPKAIEDVNWGVIIPKVKKEIDDLLDPNRQPPLSKSDAKFYSELAKEFRYFQKAWRDDVSHSRSWFDDPNEVKVIMEHSKQFMQHLASRLKE